MNEFEQLTTEASNSNAISNNQQYDLMVAQVNESYQAVVDQEKKAINEGMKAVVMGLRLGMMLTLLKEQTPHGGWEKLFTTAHKRIKSPNGDHDHHLDFSIDKAKQYMRTYKESLKNLKGERPDLLDEALNQEGPMTMEVVKRATLGAETPRQAMLHLGVIKDPRREGRRDNGTFEGSGNPAGAKAKTTEEKIKADFAKIEQQDDPEYMARKAEVFAKDMEKFLVLIDGWIRDGGCQLLDAPILHGVAEALRQHADKIDSLGKPIKPLIEQEFEAEFGDESHDRISVL